MPGFGSFFKKIFKKKAKEVATDIAGDDAAQYVDGAVDEGFKQLNIDENLASVGITEDMSGMLQNFTGSQQSGLTGLFSLIQGNSGMIEKHCRDMGLDPALVNGLSLIHI